MSDSLSESGFDLQQVDRLLTTTRAVRKRLDFERDVSDELLFECIELAEQAPTGGRLHNNHLSEFTCHTLL